mmetsp:Transcript_8497/g.20923  ORF Transcript_8497/g.20923 Transcript_8497/m.20923 type:complete len:92 (+) Transcript_8497:168-443(+)
MPSPDTDTWPEPLTGTTAHSRSAGEKCQLASWGILYDCKTPKVCALRVPQQTGECVSADEAQQQCGPEEVKSAPASDGRYCIVRSPMGEKA